MSKPWYEDFDPNGPGSGKHLFGLPCPPEEAGVVLLPVPWEATVSYGKGTVYGPGLILRESSQVDLFQPDIFNAWKLGISYAPLENKISSFNSTITEKADSLLDENGEIPAHYMPEFVGEVNIASKVLNQFIREQALNWLRKDKIVGVVGGEHSSPLGLLQALAEKYGSFGILQIDAHADLRQAYEGYEHSHASIMYNALKSDKVSTLVQVGVRDYCDEEAELIDEDPRITCYTFQQVKEEQFAGRSWLSQVEDIVALLPDLVYISYDIDGLDPSLCPGTGTPVPGGFSFDEVDFLIKKVAQSGRQIIGFDLCEVSPGEGSGEWDGNVGARVLYRLSNLTAASQKKILFND